MRRRPTIQNENDSHFLTARKLFAWQLYLQGRSRGAWNGEAAQVGGIRYVCAGKREKKAENRCEHIKNQAQTPGKREGGGRETGNRKGKRFSLFPMTIPAFSR